jgi:flagellar hook-basal body complex protein FliE
MAGVGIELGRPLGLGGLGPAEGTVNPRPSGETAGASFAETLKHALSETNAALKQGDAAATLMATGEASNLHEVVLATERANLALQFTMAIRNKLLDAYNELMRMPV